MPATGTNARDEAQRADLVGAVEAARLLGIHRSTLHLAVRKRLLVPDARTPKGHIRFRRETLDAFRSMTAGKAATGEAALLAPVHALTTLLRLLSARRPLTEMAEAAVDAIHHTLDGIDMCVVLETRPTPRDRLALRAIAHWALPDDVRTDFMRLRNTFKFATTTVLRTLQAEICEDTTREPIHTGTAHLNRIWPIGAYAAVPIASAEEALGVLVCASRDPRCFAAHERELLDGIAGVLALGLERERAAEVPVHAEATALYAVRELLDLALVGRSAGNRSIKSRILGERFRQTMGAEQVFALGFGDDLHPCHHRLLTLACAACAGEGFVREEWDENEGVVTAVAASIPLRPGHRAAVGGLWHGRRSALHADHTALIAFASAYLHLLQHDTHATEDGH